MPICCHTGKTLKSKIFGRLAISIYIFDVCTTFRAGVELEPGWPCNGPLLRMAEDVAKRLLPAFDSKTGMPYGTVNLKTGVPAGETR